MFVATFPNCLCLESRFRFLVNGTYLWFPHPAFRAGAKEAYHDVGRDPLRVTTAVFQVQLAGFRFEKVAYGGSRLGPLAAVAAFPLMALAKAHNRVRKVKDKAAPDFVTSMDTALFRNVGFRASKPSVQGAML